MLMEWCVYEGCAPLHAILLVFAEDNPKGWVWEDLPTV